MDQRTRDAVQGSGSSEHNLSHGRGGAGNIGKERHSMSPDDLTTPTIKSDYYTTGRGGTGNIATNLHNHPELARASQDVSPPVHREPEGKVHIGRGGAANVLKPSDEEARLAKERNQNTAAELERQKTNEDARGWAEKGKEFLGKIGIGEKK